MIKSVKINSVCDYFIIKYWSKSQKVQKSESQLNDLQTFRPSDLQTFSPQGENKFFDMLVFEKISNLIYF